MRYLLFFIVTCFSIGVSAQLKSPLDTISQNKRKILIEFGSHISADVIAEQALKVFCKSFETDSNTDSVFFIPSPDKKNAVGISVDLLPLLNKNEFANYIIATYSKRLNVVELVEINRVFRSNIGKKAEAFMRNILLDPDYVDESYNALDFSTYVNGDAFHKYQIASDAVYEDMMGLLFKYINEKDLSIED